MCIPPPLPSVRAGDRVTVVTGGAPARRGGDDDARGSGAGPADHRNDGPAELARLGIAAGGAGTS
eukprot:gene49444-3766_t